MASIHKDPRGRSPFYYCSFTKPNGQRVFKSTKQRNRATAQEICLKMERAAKKARSQDFGEAQARKILNEILEVSGQPPMNLQTVKEFTQAWLEGKEHAKAVGTARRYRDVLGPFLESLGSRRTINLTNLSMKDVQDFVRASCRRGLSNKTVNFRLKTVRSLLSSARRQGLVTTNVAEAVDTLPDTSAEKGTFSADEIGALLKVANDEWKGLILLGVAAGLRLGDAAALAWHNIDLDRNAIHFFPQKRARAAERQKEHVVPMLPDVEEYLRGRQNASASKSGPIFPTLSQRTVCGNAGLSNTFSRLIAQAGISNEPITVKSGKKGRTVFRLSFHSTKHTFVSTMANQNVSRELRMKIVGHTSAVHDRYTHIELKTKSEALKNFPRFLPSSASRSRAGSSAAATGKRKRKP